MVKQYVGARYVPKFASPVEWAADTSYEALTIVTFNNASYTSKVPVPPTVGNPANNPQYWVLTGNYNAQVEQYRQETENYKTEVEGYRQDTENYKTEVEGYRQDTENYNTQVKEYRKITEATQKEITTINVNAMDKSTDEDKLLAAVSKALSTDNGNYKIVTSKVLNITSNVIIDLNGKSLDFDITYTPTNTSGSALIIRNGKTSNIKIKVINGGNDDNTCNALEIYSLHHCKLDIYGDHYKGTLLRVSGKESDYTRCIGMSIAIQNYNCNRTLYHGDPVYPAAGFGIYTNVWEEYYDASKPETNLITGVQDVTCLHWESHIVAPDLDYNLTLMACTGYFGYLALGGKCKTLLNVGYASKIEADYILLGSEDGHNVNGLKIGLQARLDCGAIIMDAIGNGIDLEDKTSIANIGMIYPESNVGSIVSYNNTNKITKIENQPYSNIPRGNYRSVINEYISKPVDFTNGVGTFNIDLAIRLYPIRFLLVSISYGGSIITKSTELFGIFLIPI